MSLSEFCKTSHKVQRVEWEGKKIPESGGNSFERLKVLKQVGGTISTFCPEDLIFRGPDHEDQDRSRPKVCGQNILWKVDTIQNEEPVQAFQNGTNMGPPVSTRQNIPAKSCDEAIKTLITYLITLTTTLFLCLSRHVTLTILLSPPAIVFSQLCFWFS